MLLRGGLNDMEILYIDELDFLRLILHCTYFFYVPDNVYVYILLIVNH